MACKGRHGSEKERKNYDKKRMTFDYMRGRGGGVR